MTSKFELLKAARIAVGDASIVTRHVQTSSVETRKILKSDRSPVTVADFAAQAVVNHRLSSILGDSLVVGEESAEVLRRGDQKALTDAVVDAVHQVWESTTADQVLEAIDIGNHDASAQGYWTLDPVDGTKGFLRGQQYAISLAYIEDGEVVVGVLGCPNLAPRFDRDFSDPDPLGEIYFAIKDGGTWVTPSDAPLGAGEPVRPPHANSHTRVRVCESVEAAHSKQTRAQQVVEFLGGAGRPARLDSQCKYAVVARGQADAYLRFPNRADYQEKIWDHAAGMLVAVEAGMVASDIDGKPLDFSVGAQLCNNRGIVCASPLFHQRIIAAIRETEPGR